MKEFNGLDFILNNTQTKMPVMADDLLRSLTRSACKVLDWPSQAMSKDYADVDVSIYLVFLY
jgi:hypothetical protein